MLHHARLEQEGSDRRHSPIQHLRFVGAVGLQIPQKVKEDHADLPQNIKQEGSLHSLIATTKNL